MVELTEFSFIAGGVVELFDFVVRPFAVAIVFGARNVAVVIEIGPPSVFFVVVVEAHFPLMLICVSQDVPVRLHLIVLKEAISNRKNSPCSK